MIGSGFSRNAQPRGGSSPQFPDWSGLGDLFYEKLHHKRPDAEAKYLSVPTLANEVEAALGRPALDRILSSAIPDQDHEPAALHIRLLKFPWSDVFTTNYDTLLERACRSVASQKYDIVVNQHDLVNSERPRIVKLHGSLSPACRLIVTDEDYRRYPEDYAPFVNTVRQALPRKHAMPDRILRRGSQFLAVDRMDRRQPRPSRCSQDVSPRRAPAVRLPERAT